MVDTRANIAYYFKASRSASAVARLYYGFDLTIHSSHSNEQVIRGTPCRSFSFFSDLSEKCPLGLEDELIRFWWLRVKATLIHPRNAWKELF